jgi:hypothetical protein
VGLAGVGLGVGLGVGVGVGLGVGVGVDSSGAPVDRLRAINIVGRRGANIANDRFMIADMLAGRIDASDRRVTEFVDQTRLISAEACAAGESKLAVIEQDVSLYRNSIS